MLLESIQESATLLCMDYTKQQKLIIFLLQQISDRKNLEGPAQSVASSIKQIKGGGMHIPTDGLEALLKPLTHYSPVMPFYTH